MSLLISTLLILILIHKHTLIRTQNKPEINDDSVLFCFLCTPCGEEDGETEEKVKEVHKACSIILILGCVCVTFGRMIVSHLGV